MVISEAISRTTQPFGIPRALLESVAAYVTKLASEIRHSGPWTDASDRQSSGASKTKGAAESRPVASSRDREVFAQSREAGASDTVARFQREVVPQLDAAYNFARFLSRDADAAQDIVQEAFLRAYRSFDGYKGGDTRSWIFAIVRNCYHDWLIDRRRKARVEVDIRGKDDREGSAIDNVPSDDDNPETALLRRTETGAVRLVLSKLPRALREMLVLRELEGLSYRQIGEVAALPIGTVMSRLARARRQFESVWRQQTDQESQA